MGHGFQDFASLDHPMHAITTEDKDVSRIGRFNAHRRADFRADAQRLSQDVAVWRGFRVVLGDFSLPQELLDERVIFGQLINPPPPDPIDPTISHMTDTGLLSPFLEQQRRDGGAHAGQLGFLSARAQNFSVSPLRRDQ